MRTNRKYVVAVALLAVLAFVFGVAGTVAPMSESALPKQSSSESITHKKMKPPTFDSGWVDITDKPGQYFNITHSLSRHLYRHRHSTDIIVDIQGKTTLDGGVHQRHLGLTGHTQGWWRTYGGADYDHGGPLIQTDDGGYAMAGSTSSFGAGRSDFWLIKTDWTGDMLWNRTYGGTSYDFPRDLIQTDDGGYAIVGHTDSFGAGGGDSWLVKTDPNGNMQWDQTYGGAAFDIAWSVLQTSDGGYTIAGYTSSFGAGDDDFWLVKTDPNGNMQWNQTYGGTEHDIARSLVQTDDGGYAIAGLTRSFGAGSDDFWLVKVDSAGNMEWNHTYGGTDRDGDDVRIVRTDDGGYALAGPTWSYGAGISDFWLVKVGSAGNMEWNHTYGGTDMERLGSLLVTSDAGYIMAGHTSSFGTGGYDGWLVKTDSTGNMQWNRTFGGADNDYAKSVVQAGDEGYMIAGTTGSYGAGDWDGWLIKMGVESGLAWTDSTSDSITLYRGETDTFWNYVRVRIWRIKEHPKDHDNDYDNDHFSHANAQAIVGKNYYKALSLLSVGGIALTASIHTYKRKRQQK